MKSTPWGLTLATVALPALVLAAPAAADPLPPRGSTACWDAIADAPGVSEARAAASTARDEVEKTAPALYRAKTQADEAHEALAKLSPGDAGYEAARTRAADADTQYQHAKTAQVSAQQDLEEARAEDDRLVLAAQDRLCGPADGEGRHGNGNGDQNGDRDHGGHGDGHGDQVAHDGPEGSHGRGAHGHPGRTGDMDCNDFADQDAAQRYFSSIGGTKDLDADHLDSNHNGVACESLDDDGDDSVHTVTATDDDGSTATISGSQVTEVPEGAAQTGAV